MAEEHTDLAAALRAIASKPGDDSHVAAGVDDEEGFVDARSDDDEEHVHVGGSGAASSSDPFGAGAYTSSPSAATGGMEEPPGARAASSSDGFDYDDKWSESYHGPKLDRSARLPNEADDVPDALKSVDAAVSAKDAGNGQYARGDHTSAVASYTEALRYIPRGEEHDLQRGVYHANRAASYLAMEKYVEALYDCDRALEYNPTYLKALNRRAVALEKLKKYEDASKDYETIIALESGNASARGNLERLKRLMQERDEKLKEEMMGKLKDMGNWVLNKFGLSMDNFKAVQDPATGSYSISFQQ